MADQEMEMTPVMKPTIVAPVSRSIPVGDVARSAAFYRDVLGFEIHKISHGTEAISGPARLHFDVRIVAKGAKMAARARHRLLRDR